MLDVAILGAGELGGTLASMVASADLARTLHVIDESARVAAGKALDIAQSAPILGFATRVTGGTDLAAAAGARVIVLADPAGGGEWPSEAGGAVLRRLSFGASHSFIVCAGAGHRELVEHAVRTLYWPRTRIVGTAPEAVAGALRAMVALETNGSPKDVGLTVLGVPPRHTVVPWGDVTIGGISAVRVLDEPSRRRLGGLVEKLWPPGPAALAAAASAALRNVLGGSRRSMSVFVAPDDSQGRKTRCGALPVRLGPNGIERVEFPTLTTRDHVDLETAMQV